MEFHTINELSEEIKKNVVETQDELENTVYYGKSKDNKVKVYVKGNYDLDDVKIDPELLNVESKEVLEKDIIDAITYAMRSSRLDSQARIIELMQKFKFKGM